MGISNMAAPLAANFLDAPRAGDFLDAPEEKSKASAFLDADNSSIPDISQFITRPNVNALSPSVIQAESADPLSLQHAQEVAPIIKASLEAPLIELPKPENKGVGTGIIRGVLGTAEGLVSGENMGLALGTGGASPVIQRIISGGFGASMIKGSMEQLEEAEKALTLGERAEGYTKAALSLILGGLATKHAMTEGKVTANPQAEPVLPPDISSAAPEIPVIPKVPGEVVPPLPTAESSTPPPAKVEAQKAPESVAAETAVDTKSAVRDAYFKVFNNRGAEFPAVPISEVIRESGLPADQVKQHLLEQRAAGELILSRGDYSISTPEERAAIIPLHGEDNTLVRYHGDHYNKARETAPTAVTFKTAKGSTYEVHEDGTTTRDKAARPEYPGEEGPQKRSAATFYVDEEGAKSLGEVQAKGGPRASLRKNSDGRWGVYYLEGKDVGKFERRTATQVFDKPAIGLYPVEMWKEGSQPHFGNKITEISTSTPSVVDQGTAGESQSTTEPATPPTEGITDPAMHQAAETSAQRIADQVVRGRGDLVREAAYNAAISKARAAFKNGVRPSQEFMKSEAEKAAFKEAERSGVSLDAESETGQSRGDTEASKERTPVQEAARDDTISAIQDRVNQLPEKIQKTAKAFLEAVADGESTSLRDIGEKLGVSQQTVANHLKEMRKHFEDLKEEAISVGPGAANRAELSNKNVVTALNRAFVDAEREARGEDLIPSVPRQNETKVVDSARVKMEADPTAAPSLVSRIVDEGQKAITEHDAALLLVERRRLMNERNTWEEKYALGEDVQTATTRIGEIELELDRLDRAQRAAGSTWGRIGRMYQQLIKEDFSLEALERKTRKVLQRPLGPAELAKLKEQAAKIERLQGELQIATDAAKNLEVDAEVKRTLEVELASMKAENAAAPKLAPRIIALAESIAKRLDTAADAARARIRERMKNASAGLDPTIVYDVAVIGASKLGRAALDFAKWSDAMVEDLGEWVRPHLEEAWKQSEQILQKEEKRLPKTDRAGVKKARAKKASETPLQAAARVKASAKTGEPLSQQMVAELVRAHINAGVHGENPLMAAVHSDLKPIFKGITERDVRRAYSDYGKVKFPNQEAVAKEMAEVRNLTRLQESIDRLNEGLDAMKTGPQRDKATQIIREKQKQLNELLKKREGPPSPEKLVSQQEAKQTALRNSIEDLDKYLRTGEKPTRGEPIPDNVTTEQLRAELDAMREKSREIDAEANPGKSEAEKQVENLQKVKERLDETLTGKRPANAPKGWNPLSVAADDLKAEITAMHELAAQLKKEAKPPGDPGAVAEKQKIKALEKSIKDYEERLAKSDFSTKGKQHGPDSQRVAELKAIRDARIAAYDAAKKAGKPVRSKEEIYNERRLKEVLKKTADLKASNTAGIFARKPKPISFDKTQAVKDAEFALAKEKEKFNRGLMEADLKKRSLPRKAFDMTRDVLNTARAAMTSFDLSAVLRQGGFVALGHPIRAAKVFPAMFKAMMSEKGQFEVNQEIQSRPRAEEYRASKLHLNDPSDLTLSKMEEAYMSRWAHKIPGIAHSERAYTTFLNKLRADSFDAMAESVVGGRKLTPEEGKAIANFVNVATGRGNLASVSGASVNLNTAFFSPRYVVSRFELLAGQPLYHGTAGTRIAVAKEYARFLAGIGVIYALSQAAGAKVESDPRSADFGKLRFGNTRVDPLAGLSQATVLVSRIASGETKTPSGVKKIRGPKIPFGQPDTADVSGRFLRTKLSPVFGTAVDLSSGTDVMGQPVTPESAAQRMLVPLSFGDVYNALQDQGIPKGAAISLLALFGMSVQTYQDKSPAHKGSHK